MVQGFKLGIVMLFNESKLFFSYIQVVQAGTVKKDDDLKYGQKWTLLVYGH